MFCSGRGRFEPPGAAYRGCGEDVVPDARLEDAAEVGAALPPLAHEHLREVGADVRGVLGGVQRRVGGARRRARRDDVAAAVEDRRPEEDRLVVLARVDGREQRVERVERARRLEGLDEVVDDLVDLLDRARRVELRHARRGRDGRAARRVEDEARVAQRPRRQPERRADEHSRREHHAKGMKARQRHRPRAAGSRCVLQVSSRRSRGDKIRYFATPVGDPTGVRRGDGMRSIALMALRRSARC